MRMRDELSLIKEAAGRVKELIKKSSRNRWFFTKSKLRNVVILGPASLKLFIEAPGLTCSIEVRFLPGHYRSPRLVLRFIKYPKVSDERLDKLRNLPPLIDPCRENYENEKAWLEAMKRAEEEWGAKYGNDRDEWHSLHKPLEKMTVIVGLGRARPLKIQSKGKKTIEQVLKLRAKGQEPKDWREILKWAKIQAELPKRYRNVEKKHLKKDKKLSFERELWISQEKTLVQDIEFILFIYLLQEKMIELTQDSLEFAVNYLKKFRGFHKLVLGLAKVEESFSKNKPQRQDIHKIGITAGKVINHLKTNYALPQDWREWRKYISRSLEGLEKILKTKSSEKQVQSIELSKAAERKNGERIRQEVRAAFKSDYKASPPPLVADVSNFEKYIDPNCGEIKVNGETYYPVWGATKLLKKEGLSVSRETLYQWIKSGEIPFERKNGIIMLDSGGLNAARSMLSDKKHRKAIIAYLEATGRKPEAAKKFVDRRLRMGQTIKEIASEFISHGQD